LLAEWLVVSSEQLAGLPG